MTQTTILVAEDDAHIRMGLVDTLESEGYRVIEARTGMQALARFQAGGVDLILRCWQELTPCSGGPSGPACRKKQVNLHFCSGCLKSIRKHTS